MKLLLNFLIGLVLGYSLQRARFCFAGAFRDYLLFKDRGLLKALLVSLILSSTLFSLVQYFSLTYGKVLSGTFQSFGLYTAVGGILFGLGLIIAGSCACSIFIRLGEGGILFLFVLIGLLAGSLIGAYQQPWWEANYRWGKAVFLGEIFWWPGILLVQVTLLFTGLRYLNYQEKKEKGEKQ